MSFSNPSALPGNGALRFSRRTTVAAIDVLERMSHGDFSTILRQWGPQFRHRVSDEGVSLRKRLNALVDLLDDDPQVRTDGGELLREVVVELAASYMPDRRPWDGPQEWAAFTGFRRALQLDGYEVNDQRLRRSLPTDLHLPETEDELRRLLTKYQLMTAIGHLDQALDAHARGNWSSANGQLRNFLEGLLDELAPRVDLSAASVSGGHGRRAKLAAAGFLSRGLNEWTDDGKGFINGLMNRLHPQGAHPGLSDEEDSTFRLHTVLLTARLLLKRFDDGVK